MRLTEDNVQMLNMAKRLLSAVSSGLDNDDIADVLSMADTCIDNAIKLGLSDDAVEVHGLAWIDYVEPKEV